MIRFQSKITIPGAWCGSGVINVRDASLIGSGFVKFNLVINFFFLKDRCFKHL